jgi:hypothetical protein
MRFFIVVQLHLSYVKTAMSHTQMLMHSYQCLAEIVADASSLHVTQHTVLIFVAVFYFTK